jgi:hypothetical protein
MFIDATSMKNFKIVSDRKSEGGKKYYEIPFTVLSNELEGRLLSIDIKNNGLTDNLYMIMNLLGKNANKYEDYSVLAQYFFESIINAGINCRIVQAEIILNRLIRDPNNIYERPDFRQFKLPEYKILNLNQALLNTKAPTVGLSYQELKRQLLSDDIYETKDGSSYLDAMYSDKIDTSRLKQLAKKVKERREARNAAKQQSTE